MNYYIQGSPARAEEIKAAFEELGYSTSLHVFFDEDTVFITLNGNICECNYGGPINELIKTHPDYKELELPVKPKFKVGDWLVYKNGGCFAGGLREAQVVKVEKGVYFFASGTTGSCKFIDKNCRLWAIQDAKDGDIIGSNDCTHNDGSYIDWIGIYKQAIETNQHLFHCVITSSRNFRVGSSWRVFTAYPATKEQRELLFQKMKEAGYEWDEKKKELHKIIQPKFKVGDDIKTGNQIDTIAEIDNYTQRYYCESGRTISFANQDLWHLAPKPHYDISNFKPFDKVLTRNYDTDTWAADWFSYYVDDEDGKAFITTCAYRNQCIPFNKETKHLLGTTDMCDECYINW